VLFGSLFDEEVGRNWRSFPMLGRADAAVLLVFGNFPIMDYVIILILI